MGIIHSVVLDKCDPADLWLGKVIKILRSPECYLCFICPENIAQFGSHTEDND